MIKIVQSQDIEDVITGNIDAVKSVVYYTHLMAPEDGIHPLIKREGDVLRCKLFSNQISELITGNLICQIETAEHDEEYPDREYNETKKKNLNIWIKGKNPQDETLRVGYENLTNGLKQAVDKANTSVQPDDLTHYVKIEDFETQISEKVDRADVYVKSEIDTQINNLRGEIPSITGLATETWVETQISTKVEKSDVYSKDEINTQLNTLRGEIPSIDGLATEQWVESKGYLTQHQDLSGYVEKSEITDLVSITYLENSLKPYATEQWVESKGYLTEHQPLKTINGETITGSGNINVNGVTETWVEEKISTKVDRADVYVKDEIDTKINNLRGEIPSLDGIATETWVESKGYLTAHQDLSGYVKKSEITDLVSNTELENSLKPYATEQWVESKGYLTEHQSLAGLATEQWVESKGYLTAHQDLSGYVEKSEITNLVSITYLENSLKPYATEQWVESKGYLTEHQSLAGLATETWVETQISTKVDRNDVYSKEEVNTQINTLRGEIPSLDGVATETWVENKGYLTQHQDISGKLDSNSIWSGTAEEWELVTDKSKYIIALVK